MDLMANNMAPLSETIQELSRKIEMLSEKQEKASPEVILPIHQKTMPPPHLGK